MKKIGVLTSGGDAQGMNAAVYAVTKYGIENGFDVYAVYNGYQGLIDGKVSKLLPADVEGIIAKGGTAIGTARCPDMKTEEGQLKAVQTLKKMGIEGLVVIGGDGSFQGAKVLSTKYGIKTVGIPGTIDNDLAYTDFTLGFDSATTVAVNAINMLRDTMSCNDRSCVVEVMGRNCGDIALYSALSTGAEAVLVPETDNGIDCVVKKIKANAEKGKFSNIIVVAEGCIGANAAMEEIKRQLPEINIRSMVVGHLQRGGDATLQDRLLGIKMGAHAIKCLLEGKTDRVIGVKNSEIFDEDIVEALSKQKKFDVALYELAEKLS